VQPCRRLRRAQVPPPPRTAEWESVLFTKIYEAYADLYARLRRRRSSTLFHLPIMLLCIRGSVETIYRDFYRSFSRAPAGVALLGELDAAITAMLDPDSWHSRISIFESSVDAMKILRDPNFRRGSAQRVSSKAYGTSPVIRSLFAGDFASSFVKRQASVAANNASPRGQTEQQGAQLPLAVRQRLFRKALQRVAESAHKKGVSITRCAPATAPRTPHRAPAARSPPARNC
jgi:hypothetical protein